MQRMASTRRAATALAASLRPALQRLVAAAAHRLATSQRRLRPVDVRRKGPGDFVTIVDERTERALRRQLQGLLPPAGFLGEESTADGLEREFVWVVDPLDGTSNYSHGQSHFATSVALLWRGQPVLACVHCAPEQAVYSAVLGGGAFRDRRRLRPRRRRLDDAAMVGVQWFRQDPDFAFLARLQGCGARMRMFGSTVTHLADVACGRLDANVQQPGRVWDIAAAGLVVTEAGGRFTDWSGRPVFPFADLTMGHQPTLAAGPAAHRQLLELLSS
jgi:myo-inositol-1(or 4)-monophosphatase